MTLPRQNPFRCARISALPYRFASGFSWPTLLSRLNQLNNRGAIVGPEGSGKTTLLEQLQPHLNALGHQTALVRVTASGQIPNLRLTSRDFLLLDSAERLGWWQWQTFKHRTRHCAGVVITAHRPRLLRTLFTCRTSRVLFETLVEELLPAQSPPANVRPLQDLADVFARHQGNIRAALRELYDLQAIAF